MLMPATLVRDGGDVVVQAAAHDHTADNTGHGAGNADGNGALYRLDRNLEPLLLGHTGLGVDFHQDERVTMMVSRPERTMVILNTAMQKIRKIRGQACKSA